MNKIEEFHNWAKQFIAIQDSHVREFLESVGDLSLHEMKRLLSERYQEEISFSYSLQVERKNLEDRDNRVAFYYILKKGEYVKNLHIKKLNNRLDRSGGYGVSLDFGYGSSSSYGEGYSDGCGTGNDYRDSYGDCYGVNLGNGSGAGASYGRESNK